VGTKRGLRPPAPGDAKTSSIPVASYYPGKRARSGIRDPSRHFPVSPRILHIQRGRGPPGKLMWHGTRRRPFLARREQEGEGEGDGRAGARDLGGRGRGGAPAPGSLRRRGWCREGGGLAQSAAIVGGRRACWPSSSEEGGPPPRPALAPLPDPRRSPSVPPPELCRSARRSQVIPPAPGRREWRDGGNLDSRPRSRWPASTSRARW
jgi:hypothetical protein